MSSNGALHLGQVRAQAAAALAPVLDSDPQVLVNVVDSLTPPALMLFWDEPWLTPIGLRGNIAGELGLWEANLVVLAVASRVDPGPGIEKLEELVAYTLGRLAADPSYTWPPATLRAPRAYPIGNVTYLGAQLVYQVRITI